MRNYAGAGIGLLFAFSMLGAKAYAEPCFRSDSIGEPELKMPTEVCVRALALDVKPFETRLRLTARIGGEISTLSLSGAKVAKDLAEFVIFQNAIDNNAQGSYGQMEGKITLVVNFASETPKVVEIRGESLFQGDPMHPSRNDRKSEWKFSNFQYDATIGDIRCDSGTLKFYILERDLVGAQRASKTIVQFSQSIDKVALGEYIVDMVDCHGAAIWAEKERKFWISKTSFGQEGDFTLSVDRPTGANEFSFKCSEIDYP